MFACSSPVRWFALTILGASLAVAGCMDAAKVQIDYAAEYETAKEELEVLKTQRDALQVEYRGALKQLDDADTEFAKQNQVNTQGLTEEEAATVAADAAASAEEFEKTQKQTRQELAEQYLPQIEGLDKEIASVTERVKKAESMKGQ